MGLKIDGINKNAYQPPVAITHDSLHLLHPYKYAQKYMYYDLRFR